MVFFNCDICGKTFKTNQHLTQHKNKKKSCINNNKKCNETLTDIINNNIINKKTSCNEKNNLTINEILTFLKTYNTIHELIDDKNSLIANKNIIDELKEENIKLREQLDIINKVIQNIM